MRIQISSLPLKVLGLLALALLLPAQAFAACTSPAAAAGSLNWNGTAFQYCDGTNWQSFGGGGTTFSAGSVTAPGWAVTGDTNTGLFQAASSADTLSIASGGVESMRFLTTLSGVNYLTALPGATTVPAVLGAAGSDTNIGITLMPKGTGGVGIGIGAAAAANMLSVGTSLAPSDGSEVAQFGNTNAGTGTAYNSIYAYTIPGGKGGGGSTYKVGLKAGAYNTNAGINNYAFLDTVGVGSSPVLNLPVPLNIYVNGLIAAQFSNGGVNNLLMGGASTGNAPGISAVGTDTNVNLALSGQGTGAVVINSNLDVKASGYINFGTTVGSTGYGIRDNAGTIEYKNSSGSWGALGGGGGTPGGATTQVQYNNAGAFGADSGFTYAGSGAVTITAGAAATKPLILKGAASQSANLQEWQNSSGTALASISNAGAVVVNSSTYGAMTVTSSYAGGADIIAISGNSTRTTGSDKGIYGTVAGPSAIGVVGENINTTSGYGVKGITAGTSGYGMYGYASSTTGTATGGLFETMAASGFGVVGKGSSGSGSSYGGYFINFSSSGRSMMTEAGTATTVPFVSKGAGSQTGDLGQFLNSSGTVLTKIDASGNIAVPASGYYNFNSATGSSSYGLRDNGGTVEFKNSGGAWTSIAATAASMNTTTVVTNWPDAILCYGSAGNVTLFRSYTNSSSGGVGYTSGFTNTAATDNIIIGFNSSGAMISVSNSAGWNNYYNTNCNGASGNTITQLYAANKAFNFVGSALTSAATPASSLQYNSSGALAGAAALTYATSGSLLTTTAQAATDKPLIVKGASSQSANLQEWQNSSGTAVSYIDSAGAFHGGLGGGANQVLFNNGSSQVSGDTNFTYTTSTGLSVSGASITPISVALSGSGGNGIFINSGAANSNGLSVTNTGTGTSRGVSSISNYMGVYGSGATVGGSFYTAGASGTALYAQSGNAAAKGLIVQGAASQTGNLTEWQNSSGTAIDVIDANGKVGIGTGTPSNLVHVNNTSGTLAGLRVDAVQATGGNGGGLVINTPSGSNHIMFETAGTQRWTQYISGTDMRWYSGGDKLMLDASGNLIVVGNVSTPSVILTSDKRYKKDIAPLTTGALEIINKLEPVTYNWKTGDTDKHIGFIAQDVQKVLPDVVSTDKNSADQKLGIRYNELIPVLVKALQEQQAEIEALKAEVKSLKEQKTAK